MISPDFRHFAQLSRQGNWLPVWTTVPADLLTPVSAYLKLTRRGANGKRAALPYSFLLESVEGGETIARYTYIGADPVCVLRFWLEEPAAPVGHGSGTIEILEKGSKRLIRGEL